MYKIYNKNNAAATAPATHVIKPFLCVAELVGEGAVCACHPCPSSEGDGAVVAAGVTLTCTRNFCLAAQCPFTLQAYHTVSAPMVASTGPESPVPTCVAPVKSQASYVVFEDIL